MHTPSEQPKNSFRVTITTEHRARLDGLLLDALRQQSDNNTLKNISRSAFKELFKEKKIRIKGQNATPSSILAVGTTTVDILGVK